MTVPTSPGATGRAVVAGKLRAPRIDALPRERLHALLAPIWRQRLALVVAPAGSGKTSLLAGFSNASNVPVAWYRAEGWDSAEATLVRHLELGLTGVLRGLTGGWETVEDAAAALDGYDGGQALLVIDDLHALEGSEAEGALERLIEYAPPWLSFLIASRVQPRFNLSRLRVSDGLLEIGPDDLRFRSWEVERLFREFYGDRIPPQELATLARQTDGWAAGLQLFHLATRGKSPEERRRLLAATGRSARLTGEYLASNVMETLDPAVRAFLLETCVMGRRLSARLCDRLRGATGSRQFLEELERRGVFTVRLHEDEATYRYHEVLRSYLEWLLVDGVGQEAARARYRDAGVLMEEAGWTADALAAYCRAEDWTAVRRLLGRDGARLMGEQGPWLEHLPAAIVRRDPWLILATARWARAEGRWSSAVDAYIRAEAAFGRSPIGETCRQERLAVAAWLQVGPGPWPSRDWSGLLRAAVARDPAAVARDAGRLENPAERALVRGFAALLAGSVKGARRELLDAAEHPGLTPAAAAGARLGGGLAVILAGDPSGAAIVDRSVQEAEAANAPWLASLARMLLAPTRSTGDEPLQGAPDDGEDQWAEALGLLATAVRRAGTLEAVLRAAEEAEVRFRRLGAGTLEAWSRGLAALATADLGSPDARDAGSQAEAAARAAGVPGARIPGLLAMAAADAEHTQDLTSLAAALAAEAGLADLEAFRGPRHLSASPDPPRRFAGLPASTRTSRSSAHAEETTPAALASPGDAIAVRCFGSFSISRRGHQLDLSAVRPRSRAVLRYLALHAGTAVHREVIAEALWPDIDAATAGRSLQVAISTLRGLLEPGTGRGESQLLVRNGEAYRLSLPPGSTADVAEFEAAIGAGRIQHRKGQAGEAAAAFGRALELYRGDLLVEDGPADWVVERREAARQRATEAAAALAEICLERGDLDGATQACRTGLAIDRYHDPLWRLLIESRDRAGDAVATRRTRQEYEAVLVALGVPDHPPASLPGATVDGDRARASPGRPAAGLSAARRAGSR